MKKQVRTFIILLALIFAMSVVLVSCNEKNVPAETTAAENEATEASTETTATQIVDTTKESEGSKEPETTGSPETTMVPDTTKTPETTSVPETTNTPEITNAPETTEVPHVHAWNSWTTTFNATCTADGKQERSCACGEKDIQTIKAIGHTEVINSAVAPTCTTSGKTEGRHCSACKTVLKAQETVKAMGHSFGEWKTTKSATCTNGGKKERSCSCGEKETQTINILSHTEVIDAAVSPTCTANGKTEGKHCSVCKTVLKAQKTVKATGHSFGDWETTKSATCTNCGKQERSCSCGKKESQTIKALGHTEVVDTAIPATCEATGKTEGKHCSVCSEVIVKQKTTSKIKHIESDWIVDKAATQSEDGVRHTECIMCKKVMSEEVLYATGSVGLAYEVNSDGKTCTITGLGTCTDSKVVISRMIDGYKVTAIANRAFYNCTSITEITIPETVTKIGTQIFYKAINLHTVYYNSSYSSGAKQSNPFMNLEHITTVVFGGKKIPDYILYECENIKFVQISNNVTSIGDSAFCECDSLKEVKIGDSVTSIGKFAFYHCDNLQSVYISSLESWLNISFQYNQSSSPCNEDAELYLNGERITHLIIPDGVTVIKEYAFYNCSSLISVTISDSVTSIESEAFSSCTNLTNVTIVGGTKSIKSKAFSACTNLTSFSLLDCIVKTEANVFSGCNNLNGVYTNDLLKWCQSYFVSNPLSYAKKLYLNNKLVTHLVIPDGLKSIYQNAFRYCEDLVSVEIPDSVTYIGKGAFNGCKSLIDISIPNSVNRLDDAAFRRCTSLTAITLPDSVINIGELTFGNCTSLTTITISDSVNTIGAEAFYGCSNLTSVIIDNSVMSIEIGKDAFKDCNNLSSVYITNLENWCQNRFDNSYSSPLRYNANLYINGQAATDIIIPDGVITLREYVFWGCNNITSVTIPDSVASIETRVFTNCSNLSNIVIPNSVTSIGEAAFYGCDNLISITIPNSVTIIEIGTFAECEKLSIVTIPTSVTSIKSEAFGSCDSLEKIIYEGTIEQWTSISKTEASYALYGPNQHAWDRNTSGYSVYCTDGEIKK